MMSYYQHSGSHKGRKKLNDVSCSYKPTTGVLKTAYPIIMLICSENKFMPSGHNFSFFNSACTVGSCHYGHMYHKPLNVNPVVTSWMWWEVICMSPFDIYLPCCICVNPSYNKPSKGPVAFCLHQDNKNLR